MLSQGGQAGGEYFAAYLVEKALSIDNVFVFAVILTWNEFLFALMLTGTETRTVPVAIARTIGGQVGVDWGLMSAIETLFIIPVVLVTFVLQNQLLRGVTFGTIRK